MALRTYRQVEASKLNGAKSKGPVTSTGKTRSSLNAVKHGIFATRAVPKREGADDEQVGLDALRASLQPTTSVEEALVQEIGEALHRSGRLSRYMAAAKEMVIDDAEDCDADLKARLRDRRRLLVHWEDLDNSVSRSGLGAEDLDVLAELLKETSEVEVDPHDDDSALRQIPFAREVRMVLDHRFPFTDAQEDHVIGVIKKQRSQLMQMVRGLEERIRHRGHLRSEMGKAMPSEQAIRLAARYECFLTKRATTGLDLLVKLREAASSRFCMESGE